MAKQTKKQAVKSKPLVYSKNYVINGTPILNLPENEEWDAILKKHGVDLEKIKKEAG
jgi:hypothetical protein